MYKVGIILFCFTLIGCNNSSDKSAIIGSWVTNTCQQLTDTNSHPVNVWAKSTYEFDIIGNIHLVSTSYSDSDCITISNAINDPSFIVATFTEQDEVTTSLGIEANAITITFSSAPPPIVVTSGYYKITNNQLCLSESFHFDAGGFGIGQADDTEIDFNSCLTKNDP